MTLPFGSVTVYSSSASFPGSTVVTAPVSMSGPRAQVPGAAAVAPGV